MKTLSSNGDSLLTYKLIAGDEWELKYKSNYPYAVHNTEKTEYILSCNDGIGELTRKKAQEYISENWE